MVLYPHNQLASGELWQRDSDGVRRAMPRHPSLPRRPVDGLFPVLGGGRLSSKLAQHPDVMLHAHGGWIPLSPSLCLSGVVQWRVKPATWGWKLAKLADVSDAVLAALQHAHSLAAR